MLLTISGARNNNIVALQVYVSQNFVQIKLSFKKLFYFCNKINKIRISPNMVIDLKLIKHYR